MANVSKSLTLVGFALLLIFSSTSCMKDLDQGDLAYGDAFIRAYLVGDTIVYNTELYAYSWYEMKSVTAYSTDNANNLITLAHNDYNYTFSFIPDRPTFSLTPPVDTQYNFDVVLENGLTFTATDYLDTTIISPPIVSTLSWDTIMKRLNVAWNKVNNADYYKILLLNDENEIVFDSDFIIHTTNSINISAFSNGWNANKQPNGNRIYQVLVYAYLFEPMATTFDIQCIAVNDQNTIEWMPE